jgi:hypothetical protein
MKGLAQTMVYGEGTGLNNYYAGTTDGKSKPKSNTNTGKNKKKKKVKFTSLAMRG